MHGDPGESDEECHRRFSLLAQGETDRVHLLAEEILAVSGEAVRVIAGPRVGTLMLRLREPVQGAVFNAGEVLITEATVALGETRGYGVRLGRAPETALAAAVLDAAVAAGHPLAPRIATLLDELAAAQAAVEAAEWREISPTRVVFEEMA